MKITREALKTIVKETMIEESEYQEFFKRALEKAGKSIPDMSDEEKKKFFNNIEKTWKGKGAKNERFGRGDETELEEAQSPAQKAAFAKMLAKKDGKKEDENESVNEVSDSEIKKIIKKKEKGGPYTVVVQKGSTSKHISHAKDVGDSVDKAIKVYHQFKKKHRNGVQIIDGYGRTVFFESLNKEQDVINEASIKEGFATWEMSFSDMNLNGVKLSKKNKYKVKARNTVEAIKKAAKMAGLKGEDWIATKTDSLKRLG
jgi:hypothetical protein